MTEKQTTEKLENQAEFDLYRDTYSDQINQSLSLSGQRHDFFTKVKADYLGKILCKNKILTNEISVLDVGCGHGLIHPYLLEQHGSKLKLFGVDVASSVIDVAMTNNPNVSYQAYDGISLPYAENTFDITFAICVMHHVPPKEWTNFLKEMKRVVKPNGLVVIFEHNPINPVTRQIVKNCPLDKDAVLIRSKLMTNLMHQSGLRMIKRNYILFTPFDKSFFRKLDNKLRWLPLGAQYYTISSKPM